MSARDLDKYVKFTQWFNTLELDTCIDYSIERVRSSDNPAWTFIRKQSNIDGIKIVTKCDTINGECNLANDFYDDYFCDFITAFYLPEDVYTFKLYGIFDKIIDSTLNLQSTCIEDVLQECNTLPKLSEITCDSFDYTNHASTNEIYINGIKYIRYTFFQPCLPILALGSDTIDIKLDIDTSFYVENIILTVEAERKFRRTFHNKSGRYNITIKSVNTSKIGYFRCGGALSTAYDTTDSESDSQPHFDPYTDKGTVCTSNNYIPDGMCSINYIKDCGLIDTDTESDYS